MSDAATTVQSLVRIDYEQPSCPTRHAWARVPVEPAQDERAVLKDRIRRLLKERNAVMVSHYYVHPDLQDLAEETGGLVSDSLEMARFGRDHAATTLVEGAGGFLVPLSASETGADLAQALGLPVVLVVGLRLGCLNHALLTLEAIRARGLSLAGWVANHVDPAMLAQDDNISFLQQHLNAPLLARLAWQCVPDARTITMELPLAWR